MIDPHLDVRWRVLAELIPGEDDLVFGKSPQVFVHHHSVLNQTRHELLQHLTGRARQKHMEVIDNCPFPV